MHRRKLIKGIAVVWQLALSTTAFAANFYRNADEQPGQMSRVRFTRKFFADPVGQNDWNLAVALEVIGKYTRRALMVTLEISTDKTFSQIVDSIDLEASSSNKFFIKHRYKPTFKNIALFARFKCTIDTANTVAGISPPQILVSEIREISPWNRQTTAKR